jgi:hypothetical protein
MLSLPLAPKADIAPPPDLVAALADELASLMKGLAATETDPMAKKTQTKAVVMKAQSLINQTQDTIEGCIQQTMNTCVFLAELEPFSILCLPLVIAVQCRPDP